MPNPFLSIIIPAYNEAVRILPTLHQVTEYLAKQQYSWEVIVADDGSTDKTGDLVSTFIREVAGVTLLSLPHRGKGGAVRAGMLQAQGEYRFLCDADLSMPIEQIERFLPPQLEGFEIALGSREVFGARRIDEPSRRHIMGRIFNWLVRALAVRGIGDTQCGFKCFQREAVEVLFSRQETNGFAFDIEVLFLAQKMEMRLVEVPIDWYHMSQSKVRPMRDAFAMTKDILGVRRRASTGQYGKITPFQRSNNQ
ncbi:MAG: dolichyl-phosphate beta-glucosyltransferase [Chloroflexota bacterium]|jgi:dolichyl-phosphate beta-glucosyltransferase|nr:dolichyl-phosphate beta-glucosyltransferase [Chloroflexota bacterium]